ncbi:MAG: hypothetical protein HXS44_17485 [Theionarchaea archaeon]|nr:hypothetical protein [Theionarchaea archaeon]
MPKLNQSVLIVLLFLTQLAPIAAESVTVSIGVRNKSPLISDARLLYTEENMCLSFLVEDSNTLADIERITVVFYEIGDNGMVIQEFIWQEFGTDWIPNPVDSLFPPADLRRSKSFRFSLTAQRKGREGLAVFITAIDSSKSQTSLEIHF